MTDILICGACGAMGKTLLSTIEETDGFRAVCGVDICPNTLSIPVYENFSSVEEHVDILVDFSSPVCLLERLEYARKKQLKLVVATTGFGGADFSLLQEYANYIPIFYSANFSPAVFVMKQALEKISRALPEFDCALIETHHKHKKDAPSGTAKTLMQSLPENTSVSSLRGGTAVGVHEVIFLGEHETLTLTHRAENKKIFAFGALKACEFLMDKNVGLYGMNDLYKTTPSE
jgi:4-hydroxy-tetrahydrodipicolinate reductase